MNWARDLWNHPSLDLGPRPQRAEFSIRPRKLASQEETRKLLDSFNGEGWVMLTDRVEELHRAGPCPPGIILAAERADGDKSLHIRASGASWMAWEFERIEGDGWLFEESLERIPRGKLRYEVLWREDRDGILRPAVSRLCSVDFGRS